MSPKPQPTTEVKRLNMHVPRDLHDAFKAATAYQNESMTDVLLKFIEQYVSKHAPKANRRRP